MPVREALRALEAERLVTFRPHRGAIVAEISPEDVEEAYEIRGALEGLGRTRRRPQPHARPT